MLMHLVACICEDISSMIEKQDRHECYQRRQRPCPHFRVYGLWFRGYGSWLMVHGSSSKYLPRGRFLIPKPSIAHISGRRAGQSSESDAK